LPLAFSAQIAATAWMYRKTQIDFMKIIMLTLCTIFVGLNYEQIFLFLDLAFSSIDGKPIPHMYAMKRTLSSPLVQLGVPALFLGVSSWLYSLDAKKTEKLGAVLFGMTTALLLALVYYVFRGALNEGNVFSIKAGFVERGVLTFIFAGLGIGLLKLADKIDFNSRSLALLGAGLVHLALLRLVYFDFLTYMPFYNRGQYVGSMPIINGITLTYGGGALLCAWTLRSSLWSSFAIKTKWTYRVCAAVFAFTFVTLTVRQLFVGTDLSVGGIGPTEFYAYSIAWLLSGLGVLGYGIMKGSKVARVGSLGILLLTIGKVLFYDTAELEGLYRVFSLLGLGVSLIGVSYFYSRFVFGNDQ
jgi:uncharacterized membrane protein